jgi:hypothetical protein
MAYQQDTLHNVIARAIARNEAMTAEDITYLGTQVYEYLSGISGFDDNEDQALISTNGDLEWITGVTDTIDTAATPSLTVTAGVITAAAA